MLEVSLRGGDELALVGQGSQEGNTRDRGAQGGAVQAGQAGDEDQLVPGKRAPSHPRDRGPCHLSTRQNPLSPCSISTSFWKGTGDTSKKRNYFLSFWRSPRGGQDVVTVDWSHFCAAPLAISAPQEVQGGHGSHREASVSCPLASSHSGACRVPAPPQTTFASICLWEWNAIWCWAVDTASE